MADARAWAVAALEDLALEHGGGHVDREGWGELLVEAFVLELAAVGVVRARPDPTTAGCTDAADAIATEGDAVVRAVGHEADQIVSAGLGSFVPSAVNPTPVPRGAHPLSRQPVVHRPLRCAGPGVGARVAVVGRRPPALSLGKFSPPRSDTAFVDKTYHRLTA